jgi:Rieske Fe-S protein
MEKVPLRLAELDGPAVAHVLGEWQLRPAVVLKVHVATLRASSAARGYNTGQFALQHPTEAGMAVLAYDAKCTHLGCAVGYNATLGDSRDIPDYAQEGAQGRLLCPCHLSQFDVFDLGNSQPAQPAKRPLDAIRIAWGDAVDGSPTIVGTQRFYQAEARDADQQGAGTAFGLAG